MEGALEDEAVSGKFLNVIINETDRMSRLVTDLAALKDGLSRKAMDKRNNTAAASRRRCGDQIRCYYKTEKYESYRNFCNEPLTILGDRDSIEQVILNLLGMP